MATYDLEHDKLEVILELNEVRWRRSLHIQAEQSYIQRLQQKEADYKKWRDCADAAINSVIAEGLKEAEITCKRGQKMNKRVLRELKKRFRVHRRLLFGPVFDYTYVIKLKR